MAKSIKKAKKSKPVKKSNAKKKSAPKSKKGAKAKKSAPKKAGKVTAKKASPKKARKAAPKKVAAKTMKKEATLPLKKATTPPVQKKKTESPMSLPKAPPQLNIFPALTQRPIAHKPAKASAPSDKSRYSDEELKDFESLINGKLEKAREEFKILKETLNRNNDEGTDSTSGGNTKVLEDGAETAEKENLSQLAARQQKYIANLENALVRIKNRTYGICSVTGKLIPKERLIAVPHTTQSIEAKMMQTE
jgi:RNA polymerase-binding transcription factor DksA